MRLIDADALLEKMKCTDRYFMIKFDILEAPTVNPWHYPSKGEYPTDKDAQYFIKTKGAPGDLVSNWYEVVDWNDFWLTNEFNQIIAWQLLIPPQEEV